MDLSQLAQIERNLVKRQSQTRRRLQRASLAAKKFWNKGSLQVHDLRARGL